jgi:hypothetical protein
MIRILFCVRSGSRISVINYRTLLLTEPGPSLFGEGFGVRAGANGKAGFFFFACSLTPTWRSALSMVERVQERFDEGM